MKHTRLLPHAIFLLFISLSARSQQIVGNVTSLVQQLKKQSTTANLRIEDIQPLQLQVDAKTTLPLLTTTSLSLDTSEVFLGKITTDASSAFRLSRRGTGLRGFIVLPKSKSAFVLSSNEKGEVISSPVDIHQVMCIEYNEPDEASSEPEVAQALEAVPPATSTVYTLQSFPSATAVAYLDFDGETVTGTLWASGATINAVPGNFTETDVRNVFNLVSEDYRGFNINITTDVNVYNKAPKNRRIRCIITPTNTAAPGSGGVAYIGSFTWGDGTPCWAFNSGAKNAGEAASHEIGHTLNLKHDGRTTPKEDYFTGQGSWAPIMGAGYSKSVVQWSKGEYANANNKEDDINIISTRNGFGFRTDDYGNTLATATSLTVGTDGTVAAASNSGVIMNRTDVDIFKFTTGGGTVALTISPATSYADLDIFAAILNSNGDTLGKYNPTTLACTTSINIAAGTYYLSVDGIGAGLATATGYTDYASMGSYSISGTIPQSATVNILPNVAITNPLNNASIDGPSTVLLTATATDPDGTIKLVEFFNGTTKLGEDATSPFTFSWPNVALGSYTLSAKATDNLNGTSTSTAITITVKKADCNVSDSLVRYKAVIGTLGSYNNSGRIKETVFDKDPSTYFDAPIGAGSFVGLELQGVYRITGIRFYPRASYMSRMQGGKFQGSTSADFSTGVVDLATVSATPAAGWNCVTVSNTGTFKYIRYLGSTGSYCNVAELEFYGIAVANKAPSVSITSPANNAILTTPVATTINATATDPDGSISKVEFFSDTAKLGQDFAAPFSVDWSNVPNGTYSITAKVYDNLGEYTISQVVKVIVKNPLCTLPGQRLTGTGIGTTGSYNNTGNTFSKAFDGDTLSYYDASQTSGAWVGLDLGTAKKVTGVRFYPRNGYGNRMVGGKFQASPDRNFTLVVETLDSLVDVFENEWNCLDLHTSTRYRYIRYLSPANSRSNIAELEFYGSNNTLNSAPTIAITSPSTNSAFEIGTELPLLITANDADGSIAKVEIYAGTEKLGELTQAPFVFNYTNTMAETLAFTAVATDDEGLTLTSQPVSVTFKNMPMGIDDDKWENKVSIYPNPAHDFLTVASNRIPLDIQLMDSKGAIIATHHLVSYEQKLDLSTLTKGIYLLKIQDEGFSKIIKLALK